MHIHLDTKNPQLVKPIGGFYKLLTFTVYNLNLRINVGRNRLLHLSYLQQKSLEI